jgi:hypothetical protein
MPWAEASLVAVAQSVVVNIIYQNRIQFSTVILLYQSQPQRNNLGSVAAKIGRHLKSRKNPQNTEVEGIDIIIWSSHNTSSVHWHHFCDCHKTNHI